MVAAAMKAIGRAVSDLKGYGTEPHKDGLERMLIENLGPAIPKNDRRAGDVVLIRFHGAPRHVGLLTQLDDGRLGLIHVHSENKYVAEHGVGSRFDSLIVKVFRP